MTWARRGWVRWRHGGWRGELDPASGASPTWVLAAIDGTAGRVSRHARTRPVECAGRPAWLKIYHDGVWRARRADRMARRLQRAGFGAPVAFLLAQRGDQAILGTWDVGGVPLTTALARLRGAPKRRLLRALGTEVGRLHAAGFVHGDLVPSNVQVAADRLVFLDHDRTRRGAPLVWWNGRRNLVQLGRFVVTGVTVTDRARVLAAYADARGWTRTARRRLAAWVVTRVARRRQEIDGIDAGTMTTVGFRELMRSGGPFDPSRQGEGG